MIPLGALPGWAPRVLLVLAVASAGALAGWAARGLVMAPQIAQAKQEADQARAALDKAVAQAVERALAEERAARAEEQRRVAALKEIEDAERAEQRKRQVAADRTRAAAARLRDAARAATDALVSEATSGAGIARSGETAGTGLVLANRIGDVLGSCGERVAWLAWQLDESRARGRACERAYDALTPVPQAVAEGAQTVSNSD